MEMLSILLIKVKIIIPLMNSNQIRIIKSIFVKKKVAKAKIYLKFSINYQLKQIINNINILKIYKFKISTPNNKQ